MSPLQIVRVKIIMEAKRKEVFLMKVLLLNGSPKAHGCTARALQEVALALNGAGVETETIHVGGRSFGGCIGCGSCKNSGKCVYDDSVNVVAEKLDSADGVVFGAPIHYAAPAANMLGFMHRLSICAGKKLLYKPAATVVSARRGGTTAGLEVLNKVPQYFRMPLISGQYWPMVHGSNAQQVEADGEGLQIMRSVGSNMAWLLKCIAAGKAVGITPPEQETPIRTDFYKEI